MRSTLFVPSSRSVKTVAGVGVLAAAMLVAGCSSSSKPAGSASTPGPTTASSAGSTAASGASSAAGSNQVAVKNFSFNPSSITVPKGTTVTWTFDDAATHTVTATDKSFNSGDKSNGQTYSYTFNSPGTYSYICSIHQYMHGTVVVTAGGS